MGLRGTTPITSYGGDYQKLQEEFLKVTRILFLRALPLLIFPRGTSSFSNKKSLTIFSLVNVLGWVVRKPVNANPGLKVNRSVNFSNIKMFLVPTFCVAG